jgi:uncharacterized protein YrrD
MKEGVKLGKPKDILLDLEKHKVALVVVAKAETPHLYTVVAAGAIQSFNTATLPVSGLNDVSLAHMQPPLMNAVERDLHMRGRDVLTGGGHVLGHVVDVELDDRGNVQEYRIRRNLLDTLLPRTHAVLPSELRTAGQQVAVLDESAATDEVEISAINGDKVSKSGL